MTMDTRRRVSGQLVPMALLGIGFAIWKHFNQPK